MRLLLSEGTSAPKESTGPEVAVVSPCKERGVASTISVCDHFTCLAFKTMVGQPCLGKRHFASGSNVIADKSTRRSMQNIERNSGAEETVHRQKLPERFEIHVQRCTDEDDLGTSGLMQSNGVHRVFAEPITGDHLLGQASSDVLQFVSVGTGQDSRHQGFFGATATEPRVHDSIDPGAYRRPAERRPARGDTLKERSERISSGHRAIDVEEDDGRHGFAVAERLPGLEAWEKGLLGHEKIDPMR
jgi:hypothetical protein